MYYDDDSETVDRGIAAMHAHDCNGTIEMHNDSLKRVFGWKCSCGEEWFFRLFRFKGTGMGSKWRDEMCTSEGRRMLMHMARGALVVRSEKRA